MERAQTRISSCPTVVLYLLISYCYISINSVINLRMKSHVNGNAVINHYYYYYYFVKYCIYMYSVLVGLLALWTFSRSEHLIIE
jgi:hypothetical protein